MGITAARPQPAPAPELLPRLEYLRIYLYQLADAGHLTRDEADAIVDDAAPVPDSVSAPAAAFIAAYLAL